MTAPIILIDLLLLGSRGFYRMKRDNRRIIVRRWCHSRPNHGGSERGLFEIQNCELQENGTWDNYFVTDKPASVKHTLKILGRYWDNGFREHLSRLNNG